MGFNYEFVRIGEHLLPFLGPLPVDDGQFGRLLSSDKKMKNKPQKLKMSRAFVFLFGCYPGSLLSLLFPGEK